jgi:hypothetical protein
MINKNNMINLTYQTNQELLAEMKRILPNFKFENPLGLVLDTITINTDVDGRKQEPYVYVTPSDVIRFLCDQKVQNKLQYALYSREERRKYKNGNMFEVAKNIVKRLAQPISDTDKLFLPGLPNYNIFTSSENFERGVTEFLIPELKKIL